MPGEKIEKLVLVGFDGLMFEMVQRFVAEGRLPNMKRLIESGCWGRMNPCPPADTPTNWTTLATGAMTGTHGINSFAAWIPGRGPFDFPYFGSRANPGAFPGHLCGDEQGDIHEYCRAEYVWQALEAAGKRCVLVNFPGGWPPNLREGIVVDGLGIGAGVARRMGRACLFANGVTLDEGQAPLRWGAPTGWADLPESAARPLASAILLTGARELAADGSEAPRRAEDDAGNIYLDLTTRFYLLLTGSRPGRYDTLLVCREKSGASAVARLGRGQQSEWIESRLSYNAVFPVATGLGRLRPVELDVRFRLLVKELRADGHVELLRGTTFPLSGWAFPDRFHLELAELLWRLEKEEFLRSDAGAVEADGDLSSQIDAALHGHLADTGLQWLAGFTRRALVCAKRLLSQEPWDALFLQIHSPDGINHAHLNNLCPEAAGYDPAQESENWERFRVEYQMLDFCLGDVMKLAPKERTLFVMLSDHACLPTARRINLRHALVKEGLAVYGSKRLRRTSAMTYEEDKNGEEFKLLDLTRSKVILGGHPLATSIWVNLKGREDKGIVEPGEEFEAVRSEVIGLLRNLRDPENGQAPIALALRKEEAAHLGQWGDRVGDVLFYLRPGYAAGGLRDAVGPFPAAEMETPLFPEGRLGGCHHLYLPEGRFHGFSNAAVLAMTGPGVPRGKRWDESVRTADVAPTICHLLGIEPPRDCDGKIIVRAIQDSRALPGEEAAHA